MGRQNDTDLVVSVSEFIDRLFGEKLENSDEYDAQVVRLLRKHLGQASVHSQAGVRLAQDLVQLAKDRAKGGDHDLGGGETQDSGSEGGT